MFLTGNIITSIVFISLLLLETLCTNVTILHVIMRKDDRGGYLSVKPIFEVIIDEVRRTYPLLTNISYVPILVLDNVDASFGSVSKPTRTELCEQGTGRLVEIIWKFQNDNREIFEAPKSDQLVLLTTTGGCPPFFTELKCFAEGANMPMIVSEPFMVEYDKERFPSVLNLFPTPDGVFVITLNAMAMKYRWTSITVICLEERGGFLDCPNLESNLAMLHSEMDVHSFTLQMKRNSSVPTSYREAIYKIRERRVALLMLHPDSVRNLMIEIGIRHGDMLNGDYVFISFVVMGIPAHDHMFWKADDGYDEVALAAFNTLLIISDTTYIGDAMKPIYAKRDKLYAERYGWPVDPSQRDAAQTAWTYENLFVFAQVFTAIHGFLSRMTSAQIITSFFNRTFTLPTRTIYISDTGRLTKNVPILRVNNITGNFTRVMKFDLLTGSINASSLVWTDGKRSLPPDFPECGLHGEACWYKRSPELPFEIPCIFVFAIIIGIISWRQVRRSAARKRFLNLLIDNASVKFQQSQNNETAQEAEKLLGNTVTIGDRLFYATEIPVTTGAQRLHHIKGFAKVITAISQLRHENLATFCGVTMVIPKCYYLTDNNARGSITSLLKHKRVFLEMEVRLFWIRNLVEGVCFIHASSLKQHGLLKADLCLVDSRFCVKIALTGFVQLMEIMAKKHTLRDHLKSHLSETSQRFDLSLDNVKSDAHALATIIVELFDAIESEQEITAHSKTSAPIPEDVKTIVDRCFSDPSDGYLKSRDIMQRAKHLTRSRNNMIDMLYRRLNEHAQLLEETVVQRTTLLIIEAQKVYDLLREMLPVSVIKKFQKGEPALPELFECATVLFSDIPAFADTISSLAPIRVIEFLNSMHSKFDETVAKFDVYKVETIGDSYMVVSGVPELNGTNHAAEQCELALALLFAGKYTCAKLLGDDSMSVRIGINTGPLAAGVVGVRMPRYCLFGDAVNTASRMESHGDVNQIHVSESTEKLATTRYPGKFNFEPRGPITIKSKGLMHTFWLVSREGLN